jgi:glycosyltransferase involved in cell wall biosynthesis
VHTFFYLLPYRGGRIGLGGRWVNALNQAVIRPQLLRILRHLGFNHPILFLGSAYALPLVDHIPHRLLVYHCSDDYTLVPTFPKSFSEIETELIRRCDVIITTAEELRRVKAHLNPNIFTVTNGADVKHFSRTQDPETPIASELVNLPRPVVGYIGSVFRWINQKMVAYAAKQRPGWSFVFVGPLQTNISSLQKLPNVHFLGPRPYTALPSYLKGFDVATVPFVINEVTLRASPIKFYEYLASGLPIVATRLPDFEPFEHLAWLIRTPEEFVAGLEQAVQNDSLHARKLRMIEARKHSWEARFQQIETILTQALERRLHQGK